MSISKIFLKNQRQNKKEEAGREEGGGGGEGGYLTSSQEVPMYPGAHWHCPVMKSQVAPLRQLQTDVQPAP